MKKLDVTITDCKECPFFRHFGIRGAPGCGHFRHRLNAFSVRELPNKNETDPYNLSTIGVFAGGIPDWCPLEEVTPNVEVRGEQLAASPSETK